MPSTTSSVVSIALASSTVITPSLPTFSMASAMSLPIVASPLAEIVPTWAISSPVTGFAMLLELGDDRLDRLVDAALEVHRVGAGGDDLDALAEDRLGEHGRGRRAVAGDVGGLARDFAHHLRADVLEVSLSSISLATVTPSLVMVGEPHFFSMTTLRPLGPSVTLTALASWLTPRRMRRARVLVEQDLLAAM